MFFVSLLLATWQNDNRMKQVTYTLNWLKLTTVVLVAMQIAKLSIVHNIVTSDDCSENRGCLSLQFGFGMLLFICTLFWLWSWIAALKGGQFTQPKKKTIIEQNEFKLKTIRFDWKNLSQPYIRVLSHKHKPILTQNELLVWIIPHHHSKRG